MRSNEVEPPPTGGEIGGPDAGPAKAENLFRLMARIRVFEEALLNRFRSGESRGTTHTCLGQEAVACAILPQLEADDHVFSNHRCHGHYLAHGGSMGRLLAEIMGRGSGVCRGIGGSQHLCEGRFRSNGVQGGIVPIACGLALAEKLRGSRAISVCFLGDGTLGEGVVYEAFNLASLFSLPVLFVIEANGIAQSTPTRLALAGALAGRPRAFGVTTDEAACNDVLELQEIFQRAIAHVRTTGAPFCQIVHESRLGPHSKGDDTRSAGEIEAALANDPLRVAASHCGAELAQRVILGAQAEVEAVFREALEPGPGQAHTTEMADVASDSELIPVDFVPSDGITAGGRPGVECLRAALAQLLSTREDVIMVGEDILDPYGGAFKATKSLQAQHPARFFSTPISEAGIVGLANGLALGGMRPVVEIMFGDFLTLAADQLVNHAAKFHGMYARQAVCPVIVRAPMGGYRGYGPTHSQCMEKLFLGVPGLVVTASSPAHDLMLLWERMCELRHPVLHVENKAAYGRSLPSREGTRLGRYECESSRAYFPTLRLRLAGRRRMPQAVILTYGGMTFMALEAMLTTFEEHELGIEACVFSQLSPTPVADLLWAVGDAPAFVTLEEGPLRAGWGAEVCASLLAREFRGARRVAALDSVVPASESGEFWALPSVHRIVQALLEVCRERA